MRREITSFSNPEIKRLRSLREKKHRRREGRFLAEGIRIVAEAMDEGFVPETLILADGHEYPAIVADIEKTVAGNGGTVIATSNAILSKISGKDNPQSLVAVFQDHPTAIDELDRNSADIWIVAQAIRDPGNLGTMLRTGDAVGAGGLILVDDCTDPFSVETVRASMGAVFTQKIVPTDWQAFIAWLREGTGQLVGTSLQTEQDYQAVRYDSPAFLLVGNESQGLPRDYEAQCDVLVKMPMMGKADSLNAAVATAVMAYELLNQRRAR